MPEPSAPAASDVPADTATTVYAARLIHTMNPARPQATHVAVREGRILGAGTLQELAGWGPFELDERFAGQVLLPGLVEGHSHLMAGGVWRHAYCGWFDVVDPAGRRIAGSRSLKAVVDALSAAAATRAPAEAVAGWGLDPIYFGTRRCTRADLDQVSTTAPVGVLHASAHILNVNSVALERAGFLRPGLEHPGIPLGPDGLPTGELRGPEAMMPALQQVGLGRAFLGADEFAVRAFGQLAVRAGVTTATDLAAGLLDEEVQLLARITAEAAYPLRLVPLLRLMGTTPAQAVARARELAARSTEQLRLGRIKLVADGSIQGFTARLRWPGYHNGAPNGLWYTPPQTLREAYALGLQHGVQMHTHTNGDEATEMALGCLEEALAAHPRPDHRFTLQHCQLADAAQVRRMKALGACANFFANHHYYWGDQHHDVTVGPERAQRMNPCRSARDAGVPFSVHSDAPITPLGPLFTAWCAVNRFTASGRVLGEHERIGVMDALHAVTLGAAVTLKLDAEIGSIECGKRADFCVLEDDPLQLPPERLKDARVWGTVQGGRVFAAP
jgi:predicted amidohydrolase YtcJ